MMSGSFPLPAVLPRLADDSACAHLTRMRVPSIALPSTGGRVVNFGTLSAPRTVIYCYPMTGVPGKPLPEGWDLIPGARGCTPQTCGFRDRFSEIAALGAEVFGLSTQSTEYQREMVERLHVPFEVLSDADFTLCDALRLPTFEVEGMRLVKWLTLVVREGVIEKVFYPVFPPNESAEKVIGWLERNPL
jgi:peroxiredoxin